MKDWREADRVTGIALARKHHIDVVVLDFSMPGMDSHQVAQVLMKDDPTLPVVMWSGDIDDLPDCLERFVDALLRKGGGPETFPSGVEPVVAPKVSA